MAKKKRNFYDNPIGVISMELRRRNMLKSLKEDGLEITPKGMKSFNKAYPKPKKKKK